MARSLLNWERKQELNPNKAGLFESRLNKLFKEG